jgi:predicted metal-dependent enzyme (double-stranded beta helix superfamily)
MEHDDAIVDARMRQARAMLSRVRALAADGVTRDSLARIRDELMALAAQRALFPLTEFLPEGSGMYRLSEDADHRFALYVVAPPAGGFAPPHDHSTWAVIAGVHGREHNKLYRRTDDGTVAGHATLERAGEIDVVAGTAVTLMPEDIHSIHLGEDGPHANLHLYGVSVEHCPERRMYSLSKQTFKVFPPARDIRRARGAD